MQCAEIYVQETFRPGVPLPFEKWERLAVLSVLNEFKPLESWVNLNREIGT